MLCLDGDLGRATDGGEVRQDAHGNGLVVAALAGCLRVALRVEELDPGAGVGRDSPADVTLDLDRDIAAGEGHVPQLGGVFELEDGASRGLIDGDGDGRVVCGGLECHGGRAGGGGVGGVGEDHATVTRSRRGTLGAEPVLSGLHGGHPSDVGGDVDRVPTRSARSGVGEGCRGDGEGARRASGGLD